MFSRPRLLRVLLVVGLLGPIGLHDQNLSAQVAAVKDLTTGPDVKGAERLFSAWLQDRSTATWTA